MAVNTRLWKPSSEGRPKKAYRVIKNSETIMVGDWIVDEATGVADIDATTEHVLGYVVAIVTSAKTSLEAASVDTSALGGTWTSSTKQYAAASDNVTVDGVMAEYVPAREGDWFLAILDAAKGTTTGSDTAGYYLAVSTSDASLLDESTAATSKASTQFKIEDGYNQGSTTEVIVSVHHRETSQYTQD